MKLISYPGIPAQSPILYLIGCIMRIFWYRVECSKIYIRLELVSFFFKHFDCTEVTTALADRQRKPQV